MAPARTTVKPVTAKIALFPLSTVLFPGGPLPLRIFETRYTDMVRRCMREQTSFGVVLIHVGNEAGAAAHTATVGTTARIVDFYQLPDGLLGISCVGERKFRIENTWRESDGLNMAEVIWLPVEPAMPVPEQHRHLSDIMRRVVKDLEEVYQHVEKHYDDAVWVGSRLTEVLPLELGDKQVSLELDDPIVRLDRLAPVLKKSTEDD
jgi:Lon protease-like protein